MATDLLASVYFVWKGSKRLGGRWLDLLLGPGEPEEIVGRAPGECRTPEY